MILKYMWSNFLKLFTIIEQPLLSYLGSGTKEVCLISYGKQRCLFLPNLAGENQITINSNLAYESKGIVKPLLLRNDVILDIKERLQAHFTKTLFKSTSNFVGIILHQNVNLVFCHFIYLFRIEQIMFRNDRS